MDFREPESSELENAALPDKVTLRVIMDDSTANQNGQRQSFGRRLPESSSEALRGPGTSNHSNWDLLTPNQENVTVQLIEDFPLKVHIDPETRELQLKSMLFDIVENYNISLENKEIYFYLKEGELFINCGIEPISEDVKITPQDFIDNKEIVIKAKRLRQVSILHKLMAADSPVEEDQEERQIPQKGTKSRRTKERRIGHIIEKVIEWRRYYCGESNSKNQLEKLGLDEAAKKVNISKKSLDDYLFQIRLGHRHGFNFNDHYNDKVGVLRDFVRQKKQKDIGQQKARKQEKKAKRE